MDCQSRKRRYDTETDAQQELAAILANDGNNRHEQRAYLCELCCGWHLTRQPPPDPLARRRRRT